MTTFVTGGTGYLGGYVVDRLLRADPKARLSLLVRGESEQQAHEKLWRALQFHRSKEAFFEDLRRIDIILGDLHAPRLGMTERVHAAQAEQTVSVLHIAASLNRKSERACLNTNLRGSLSTVKFAMAAKAAGSLKRFSHVSTVAVAERSHEVVKEDAAIDWQRRDYDPYARTKKFCEHMVRELLFDTSLTFFRPSIVLGDSQKPATTQFDMIQAVSVLAELPWVPLDPNWRVDIVPANYVADAICRLHRDPKPKHRIFHLSSGTDAPTVGEIGNAISSRLGKPKLRFAPQLEATFRLGFDALDHSPRTLGLQGIGALMKVFWPYVTFDTVFDNKRVIEAMEGRKPVPFPEYAAPLLQFARDQHFRYPYQPL